MAENLRATQYTNGEAIPYVDNTSSGNVTWTGLSTGAYTIFNHSSNNSDSDTTGITSQQQVMDMYGLLYNGYAANDDRGICPTGWRVSTDTDWKTLEMYLGMTEDDANTTGWRYSGDVGKKLKYHLRNPDNQDADHPRWDYDATHYGIDSVGFSALPGGLRNNSNGVFYSLGARGWWWSWSFDGATSYRRQLYLGYSGVDRSTYDERFGFSVRCLRD